MKEIVLYFLKIGTLGFGGPMAHIAMMDEELIEKRQWVTKETFLEGLAVCNLLPGPASTQLGLFMGYVRGGLWGGLAAGVAFVFPAFVIINVLSYLYFSYGTLPEMQGIIYGVNAVVIALISTALYKMGRKAIVDRYGLTLGILSTLAVYVLGINIILVLVLAGIMGVLVYHRPLKVEKSYVLVLPILFVSTSLLNVFTFFLKVGSFIYGGGLVIIPFIEREVVVRLGWLTQSQFLTGISLGQITPGPVVITSAFIGYKLQGVIGASVATLAIFLPSFVLILVAAPYLARLKNIPPVKAALKGVNAAVIGTILASVISLMPNAITDIYTLLIAVGGFIAILKFNVGVVKCVVAAGILGMALSFFL